MQSNGEEATGTPKDNYLPVPRQSKHMPEVYNPFATRAGFLSWIKSDTPAGKAVISKCLNGKHQKVGEMKDEPFEVRNVLVHPVEIPNHKTGEIEAATRMVLIGPEGQMYETVSAPSLTAVGRIINLYGDPPWDPPLRFVHTTGKSRSGFEFHSLEVWDEAMSEMAEHVEPAKPKSKR